ncbi:cytidine deaminase [Bacteriovorax sp. Seq25_V]|uniref:cytidine deaminase n=1 Tax=Bacteriovorax sp. Seq25_V TaxID=1201288 RepID=UPI00038A1EDC|nr:cytidine deaminase [Bacteriovorax sp. Seq25_V]EQC46594.1 cytidine deaminase [Bacteriovorax sp. Seq25_V]
MTRVEQAYELAKKTRNNAYAKYSNFFVGSAISIKGVEKLYGGCNVENISFGATICAERNAILNAVAENGKIEIEFVVVCVDTNPVTVPCGMCLQVISEFCKADTPIYLGDLNGIQKTMKFNELLPAPFDTLD